MKLRNLEQHLKKHGCVKKREGGSHTIWQKIDGYSTSVPRHAEVKKATVRAICKQLEIPILE